MKLFINNSSDEGCVEVQNFKQVLDILDKTWTVNGGSGINTLSVSISSKPASVSTEDYVWYPIIGDFLGETTILGYVNFWDADYLDRRFLKAINLLMPLYEKFPIIEDLNNAFIKISEILDIEPEIVHEWRVGRFETMTVNQLRAICTLFNFKSKDLINF